MKALPVCNHDAIPDCELVSHNPDSEREYRRSYVCRECAMPFLYEMLMEGVQVVTFEATEANSPVVMESIRAGYLAVIKIAASGDPAVSWPTGNRFRT